MTYVAVTGEARFESIEALAGHYFDQIDDDHQDVAADEARAMTEAVETTPEVPLGHLGQALIQLGVLVEDTEPAAKANAFDISYQAARVRNGLPRGIELLESTPAPYCEETISASIRRMMVAQKRERSLAVLPDLEPVNAGSESGAQERPAMPAWARFIRFDLGVLSDSIRDRLVYSLVPVGAIFIHWFM